MYVVIVIFSLIAFFAKGSTVLDSDLGWHIRMGEIILKSGIPKVDPLSYTMPSYPFVDHEWLTNIFISLSWQAIGQVGLAALCSVITVTAILLQVSKKYRKLSYLPIILIFGALFPFEGVRTQVLSWLFISLLISDLRNHSSKHILPIPLIIIWVNLHGSFPLGLVVFAIYIGTDIIKHKKINRAYIVIFITTLLATLLNPYGYRIWWEVWMQMSDTSLRWSIIEWMPAIFFLNLPLWMYAVISTTVIFRYRKRYGLFDLTTYIVLLAAWLSSYRHAPLWMIVSLVPTLKALKYFKEEVGTYLYGKERHDKFIQILLILAIISGLLHLGMFIKDDIPVAGEKRYPSDAIHFLRELNTDTNVISIYEWGGYLSWRFPEKKVFIDGRMPSWRWKSHNRHESDYAFPEYREALYGDPKNFEKTRKKYNIEFVLLPKPKPYVKGKIDIELERLIIKFFTIKEPDKKKKSTDSMKKIYEDDVAVIYKTTSP